MVAATQGQDTRSHQAGPAQEAGANVNQLSGPGLRCQRPRGEVQQAEADIEQAEENRPDAVTECIAGPVPAALDANMDEHRPAESEKANTDPAGRSGSPLPALAARGYDQQELEEYQQVEEEDQPSEDDPGDPGNRGHRRVSWRRQKVGSRFTASTKYRTPPQRPEESLQAACLRTIVLTLPQAFSIFLVPQLGLGSALARRSASRPGLSRMGAFRWRLWTCPQTVLGQRPALADRALVALFGAPPLLAGLHVEPALAQLLGDAAPFQQLLEATQGRSDVLAVVDTHL
jgi:hypothetical protein